MLEPFYDFGLEIAFLMMRRSDTIEAVVVAHGPFDNSTVNTEPFGGYWVVQEKDLEVCHYQFNRRVIKPEEHPQHFLDILQWRRRFDPTVAQYIESGVVLALRFQKYGENMPRVAYHVDNQGRPLSILPPHLVESWLHGKVQFRGVRPESLETILVDAIASQLGVSAEALRSIRSDFEDGTSNFDYAPDEFDKVMAAAIPTYAMDVCYPPRRGATSEGCESILRYIAMEQAYYSSVTAPFRGDVYANYAEHRRIADATRENPRKRRTEEAPDEEPTAKRRLGSSD